MASRHDDADVAKEVPNDTTEMTQVAPVGLGNNNLVITAIETAYKAPTSNSGHTDEKAALPRFSTSASTSPLSFGQSVETGDALVDSPPGADEPHPILTGTHLLILIA